MSYAENQLIQFPSGAWGYVGRVDARLAFTSLGGEAPDPRQIEIAQSFGPRLADVRMRTWKTHAAAVKSALELGYTIK